jgi:hypothetical protein
MKTSDYLTKISFSSGLSLPQCIHFFWKSTLPKLHFGHIHTIFFDLPKNQSIKTNFKNLILFYINDFFIILMFGGFC